jgi:hypothetical protein
MASVLTFEMDAMKMARISLSCRKSKRWWNLGFICECWYQIALPLFCSCARKLISRFSKLDSILLSLSLILRPTVSRPVFPGIKHPSGAHDQIFITFWQLRFCFYGVPSLTRWRVCLLYTLLALGSAVLLGSQSLCSRDHILLSHVWDFPFRRLLRRAGWQWRYSIPPPYGCLLNSSQMNTSLYSLCTDHAENTDSLSLGKRVCSFVAIVACVFIAKGVFLASRCLAVNLYSGFTIPAFGRHVTVR